MICLIKNLLIKLALRKSYKRKYLSYIAFVVNLNSKLRLNIICRFSNHIAFGWNKGFQTNFENCGYMKHIKKLYALLNYYYYFITLNFVLCFALQKKCLFSIWNATLGWNRFRENSKLACSFVLHLFAAYSSILVTKMVEKCSSFFSMCLLKSVSESLLLVSILKL